MSRLLTLALFVSFLPGLAAAQDAAQRCHEKATRQAGIRDTSIGDGRASITLGGSVGVGASRSSGPATARAPAYAGSAASERFEEKRKQKIYRQTYDACMAGR